MNAAELQAMRHELAKTAVSTNWLRERIAQGLMRRGGFKGAKTHKDIAQAAQKYVRTRESGGDVRAAGDELRNVIKKYKQEAEDVARQVDDRAGGRSSGGRPGPGGINWDDFWADVDRNVREAARRSTEQARRAGQRAAGGNPVGNLNTDDYRKAVEETAAARLARELAGPVAMLGALGTASGVGTNFGHQYQNELYLKNLRKERKSIEKGEEPKKAPSGSRYSKQNSPPGTGGGTYSSYVAPSMLLGALGAIPGASVGYASGTASRIPKGGPIKRHTLPFTAIGTLIGAAAGAGLGHATKKTHKKKIESTRSKIYKVRDKIKQLDERGE